MLEFTVPPGFGEKDASGRFVQRGVQVGYFQGTRLMRLVDIPRDEVTVRGDTAQISVPLFPASGGSASVMLKVRVLAANPGAWSAEMGPVELPAAPAGQANRRARRASTSAPGRVRPRAGAAAVLGRRPQLAAALKDVAPDLPPERAFEVFPQIRDLATAVIVSREQKVAFTALLEQVAGPPQKDLEAALRSLRAGVDASVVVRNARRDARALVSASSGRPPRK